MLGYIYCYTNIINFKKYIGQTVTSPEERAGHLGRQYLKKTKDGKFQHPKFAPAIIKYGWDKFELQILETIDISDIIKLHLKLNELERYYISYFDTYLNGYNADLGGSWKIVSEETKQKLSIINRGKSPSEETRSKISAANKGKKKCTNVNYIKAAEKRKGIPLSTEIKEKISKTKIEHHNAVGYISKNKGKKHSDEWNKKVSAAMKGCKAWNKGKVGINRMKQNELLKKLQQITLEFKATNSRNDKKELLKKYKEDTDFKQLLKYVYDPFIIFGIGEKKLEKDLKSNKNNNNDYKFFDLLKYLSEHNTGSYKEVHLVRCFIDKHYEYKDFICSVITKNLILGIDIKTINSVIDSLCNTFSVQLANKYFDNPKVIKGKEFAITTKIDGGRIIALKENGEVTFYTRQGQKYEGLTELENEMKEFMPDGICLDGELTLLNRHHLSSSEQYKATMKESRKDGEKHGLKMLVFDAMKAEQFRTQKCDTPYTKRHKFLENIFANTNPDCYSCAAAGRHAFIYFELLPILYQGDDINMIEKILHEQVENGEEGIMINILDAGYDFKRSNNLLKVKLFNDLDLECVGFEEGTNRNKGTLGALLLKYNDNIVKCGSGFSDELRNEIWQHQEDWLCRTITIKYFEESYDSKTGLKSLRFPVYVDYRADK